VMEGERVMLTQDLLNTRRSAGTNTSHSGLTYRVITSPRLGRLTVNNQSAILQFTQADLDQGRVFYQQTRALTGSDVTPDSFRFELVGVGSEGEVVIEVRRRERRAQLVVNVPVTVIEGYRTSLTTDNLHAIIPSQHQTQYQANEDVMYSVVEGPRHGELLRAGEGGVERFTQADIDQGRMEYRSDGADQSMMDYFLFTLSSSSRNLTGPATLESEKPLFFSILIQPVTKIPPTIVRVRSPERLVALGSGRVGFILTGQELKATHPLFDSREVMYQLRTRPRHGYLEHLRSRRPIRRKFSQKDLDESKIVYVLNEETSAVETNDSFTFRVMDLNRNYVDNLRSVCRLRVTTVTQGRF